MRDAQERQKEKHNSNKQLSLKQYNYISKMKRKKNEATRASIRKIELKIWYKFHAWTKRFADTKHTQKSKKKKKNYGSLNPFWSLTSLSIIIIAAAAAADADVFASFISFFCSISFHFIFQSGIS